MAKYLDDNGLLYFWQKIKNTFSTKAQTVTNITRSGTTFTATRADTTTFTFTQQDTTYSNATQSAAGLMSAADKTALDNLVSTSGEPNQDAFSKVKVGSTTIAADDEEDTLELVGSNVTLTPDATNDKVTIGVTDTNITTALGSTPVPRATADASGNNIASTYALKTEIAGVYKYKGSVAAEANLPSTGQTAGDVYNIESASTYGAAGANVAWNGSAWDSLGEIFSIASITNGEIDTMVAS